MTEVSRRAVLCAGAGTATILALGIEAPHADAATLPERSHYTKSVGRTFTARRGKHVYKLRLSSIGNLPHTKTAQRNRCFLLVFEVLGSVRPADGTFTLRRSGVRTHSLFLSGLGPHRRMQAVVNRSV